jgi:hypothetical protein
MKVSAVWIISLFIVIFAASCLCIANYCSIEQENVLALANGGGGSGDPTPKPPNPPPIPPPDKPPAFA